MDRLMVVSQEVRGLERSARFAVDWLVWIGWTSAGMTREVRGGVAGNDWTCMETSGRERLERKGWLGADRYAVGMSG